MVAKRCGLIWAAALLVAAFCHAQEPQNVPVLRLDDAVRIALEGNRQVQITSFDIRRAAEATAQTKALRLPQFQTYLLGGTSLAPIRFTIPQGALGVYPNVGPIPGREASITTPRRVSGLVYASASQPLTQLFKISLALQESKLGEQGARENLRKTRSETVSAIKSAYYQLAQTQSEIESAEASLRFLLELFAQTERNLAEQTVLKADSLAVKAKVAKQRYQLLTLRDSLQTQKEALNRLLGRDLQINFSVETQPLLAAEELDLSASQKTALEHRSEVRLARLQSSKSELEVKRERADYIPDISFQISHLSFPNVNFAPQNITSASLLMQWQPFDWGQRHHRVEQLKLTSAQNSLTQKDVEQQVLQDVNASYRRLLEARALLETQAAGQEAEREKLRVILDRNRQNAALLSDVLQQQSALATADAQYQQALQGFWSAKAAFSRALGEDY